MKLFCIHNWKHYDRLWKACSNIQHVRTLERIARTSLAMIKNRHVWTSFTTEVEVIKTLQMCYSDFKISYIQRTHDKISDFLAKIARSFHRELYLIWLFYSVFVIQTTSSLSNRIVFSLSKKKKQINRRTTTMNYIKRDTINN